MTAQTLKGARAQLAQQLDDGLDRDALGPLEVLGFEPPKVERGITVTVSTAGFTDTEWQIAVRVYSGAADVPDEAQDQLDDVATAVDPLLAPTPRSEWETSWDEGKEAFVAETVLEFPREDF